MQDEPPRALGALEDEELVDLAVERKGTRDGDAAVAELFGRYHVRVVAWCRRIIRDPERARDAAQDAQLKALGRLDRFEHRAKFSSWLFVIVRNTCLNAVRPVSLTRDPDVDPDSFVDPVRGADLDVESAQEAAILHELLRTELEDDERRALALRSFERMSVDAITEILGLENRSGARALLQRARRKLRAALERDRSRRST